LGGKNKEDSGKVKVDQKKLQNGTKGFEDNNLVAA
jgi:hypothetical protein